MYCQREDCKNVIFSSIKLKLKIKLILILVILCCVVISCCLSCSGIISVQTENFFTMDTFAESTVITKSDTLGKEINKKIEEICIEADNRISRTVETSEIFVLNHYLKMPDFSGTANIYELSKETGELLRLAQTLQNLTNDAFNPRLGDVIDLWDINNPDENAVHVLPQKGEFYDILFQTQAAVYDITQNGDEFGIINDFAVSTATFDLGGIGKGYALDCIADYLRGEKMQNSLVSLSSSILALGKNKSGNMWSIGIKDPLNPEKICGYISATDKVVSVSGGYERFITINGIDYAHIIDPETGYPVDNDLLCVVVVMNAASVSQPADKRERYKDNGAISDAISTALYVMGKDKAIEFYNTRDYKGTTDLDFDMILFVKKDDDPKGYEIIPINVIFNELD